jgi:sulfate permease, SulP family
MEQAKGRPAPGGPLDRGVLLERLIPILSTAFVVAVVEVVVASSFAALIFAGPLSAHVQAGIGLNLIAGVIVMVVLAIGSSQPGTVGSVQDVSAAILALVAAGIVARMGPDNPATFLTVVLAIGLTSAVTGGLFVALGALRLGDLVRFVPYPVVGGFLAGTGWLLVKGAAGIMTGTSLTLTGLASFFSSDSVTRWFPGLIVAVVLLGLLRRYQHFLIIPTTLVAAVVLFFAVMVVSGTSLTEAEAGGWLLGPFPSGQLWRPWALEAVGQADWGAIGSQAGNIGTTFVISLLALLLNASGIELLTNRDVDLNRELTAAGVAGLASGAAGGTVGFHTLSLTAMAVVSGARSRAVGLISAALCGAVLLFGASFVGTFPRFVLGGLILFLGLSFLIDWLYDAWFRLARPDYAVVVGILLVVAFAGFLQGVALGVVVAVILFVVNYSRTEVVRHVLTGESFTSNVERSEEQVETLRRLGEAIHIFHLHGFIFFGTANTLVGRITERIRDRTKPAVRMLVLDFGRVTGLDSSAVISFAKVLKLADSEGHEFDVVLTGLSASMRARLARGGLVEGPNGRLRFFSDLDRGMQWCEDRLLSEEGVPATGSPRDLWSTLGEVAQGRGGRRRLLRYLERLEVAGGTVLIHQGSRAEELFFLESGRLTVRLRTAAGSDTRLRTMGAGTVVGELPLYLGTERTASVIAEEPSVVYRLSLADFARMERDDPEMAAALHRLFARLLARRLVDTQRSMAAIMG